MAEPSPRPQSINGLGAMASVPPPILERRDVSRWRRCSGGADQDARGLQVQRTFELCGLHTAASPARSDTFRILANPENRRHMEDPGLTLPLEAGHIVPWRLLCTHHHPTVTASVHHAPREGAPTHSHIARGYTPR